MLIYCNFAREKVTVWGEFSYKKKLLITWILSKIKADDYITLLEISLTEYSVSLLMEAVLFHQLVHVSHLGVAE